jgi:hypothetical protein
MIEQHLLEIATSDLDEHASVNLLLIGEKWIFNITILSLKYDCVKYTYYENSKDKKNRRLVQRITPFEKIDEIVITFKDDKNVDDLKKDLSLTFKRPVIHPPLDPFLGLKIEEDDSSLDAELEKPIIIELDPDLYEE